MRFCEHGSRQNKALRPSFDYLRKDNVFVCLFYLVLSSISYVRGPLDMDQNLHYYDMISETQMNKEVSFDMLRWNK